MKLQIPLSKPYLTGKELHYIALAIAREGIGSDGPFTQRCSEFLEQTLGIAKVLLTPSCTAALELAAMLCNLGPGDEVLLPSFTFTSTATAVVRLGAKPVFVDVDPDTMNLDPGQLERRINRRTRAIVPVHYAGVACDLDPILAIAKDHQLHVIEDAAQAVAARYRGRPLGSFGDFGAFSFHETKNFICGEGGALCVNDPAAVERALILREKGTNRTRFRQGLVDKYTWVDQGSSYVPAELCSAFLLAQLEAIGAITRMRQALYERYLRALRPLEESGWLRLPRIPDHAESNYHLFHLLLGRPAWRDALLAHLRQRRIQAAFHYVPLHLSPMGERFGYRRGDLPVTESCSERLLRLPLHCDLSFEEQDQVIDEVHGFFASEAYRQAA